MLGPDNHCDLRLTFPFLGVGVKKTSDTRARSQIKFHTPVLNTTAACVTMGPQQRPSLLVIVFILICVAAPGFSELRFYLDASAKDDGVITHNILGADYGPAEFNVTAQLIFLEPDQDCESFTPHSMYNGTIDYAALSDFVLYWDLVCKFKYVTRITSNHVVSDFFSIGSKRSCFCPIMIDNRSDISY